MEVFIRDEDMPKNCCSCKNFFMNPADTYSCSEIGGGSIYSNFTDGRDRHPNCPLKSLNQHDLEIRAEERKKVVAELKTNYGGIEKDIITEKYHLTNFDCDITKPIKQIIKEERKKVVAELQEWNDKLIDEGYIIDYEDLQQKLTEIKERK